ncbi:DUF1772 family protein [Schizosaccharomyces octosporus yFS286]|uniref:DUF1772 family protein n=1 Tax=Schizosaccharomyces octosporus (strain yFS286) TaxID=483514 RepID=S9Q4Z7_SCHOY|nr:DUF1772 family protein [Schizosaccharomyces octosporus yFS286]EPX75092.1 DUF1772 family protein [Schizosaccharomyces octosporus yFS286]
MNFNLVYLFQAAGVLGPSMGAGAALYISAQAVPLLLMAPADVGLAQFKYMYLLGKRTFPFVAIGSTLAQGCLAYWERRRSVLSSNLHLLAGSACTCVILYTLLFMRNINGTLLSMNPDLILKSTEATVAFRNLIQKWCIKNLGRCTLFFFAAVSSFAGTFLF